MFCVLQSVLLHPAVVDCAVVGLEDSLKGHVPLALCVLRNGEAYYFPRVLMTQITYAYYDMGCVCVCRL